MTGSVACTYGGLFSSSRVASSLRYSAESDPALRADVDTILGAKHDRVTGEVAECMRTTLLAEELARDLLPSDIPRHAGSSLNGFGEARLRCVYLCPLHVESTDTTEAVRDVATRWTARCTEQFSDASIAAKERQRQLEETSEWLAGVKRALAEGRTSSAYRGLVRIERRVAQLQTQPGDEEVVERLRADIAALRNDAAIGAEETFQNRPEVIRLHRRLRDLEVERDLVSRRYSREQNRRQRGCPTGETCDYTLESDLEYEVSRVEAELREVRLELKLMR